MQTKNVLFYVVLASLVFSVVLPFGSSLVSAATPVPTLTPVANAVAAGAVDLFTSANVIFSGASVNFYLSTNSLATVSGDTLIASQVPLTSNHGLSNQNVTIPASTAPGVYYVKATDGQTVVVSSPIQVLATPFAPTLTLTPSSATAFSQVAFCGSNFVPGGSVTVYFVEGNENAVKQTTTPSTVTVGSNGLCSGSFSVPDVSYGVYQVVVVSSGGTPAFSYQVSSPNTGASESFLVLGDLEPVVAQSPDYRYLTPFIPIFDRYYSVLANAAGASLLFGGFGLPAGSIMNYNSIPVYNATNQIVGYGVTHPVSTSGGVFSAPSNYVYYTIYNGLFLVPLIPPAINVTFVTGLPPGAGYYIQLNIGGVRVNSTTFIASVPTNGAFQALISPTTGSGYVDIGVQAYGLFASSTVQATNFFANLNGPITADANGAAVFSIGAGSAYSEGGLPNGTYPVSLENYNSKSTVTMIVGYYTATPSFGVTDIMNGNAYGYVGDTITISAPSTSTLGSFPVPFQATSVTFKSMANGYTTTVLYIAGSTTTTIASQDYESDSNGFFSGFNVTLPALPAGPVSVTLNGDTKGGVPVSITGGSFTVLTRISAIYWANPSSNAWDLVSSSTQLFAGDILDVQISGFPVNETANLTFSTPGGSFMVNGVPISGSSPSSNGSVELVLFVPFSAPFGTYYLLIDNGYGVTSTCAGAQFYIGPVLYATSTVTLLRPGQYTPGVSTQAAPHVYIDPMNVNPESSGRPPFMNQFYSGQTVYIVGTGFTQSAKLFVQLTDNYPSSSPLTVPISILNTSSTQYGVFKATVNLPMLPTAYCGAGELPIVLNYSIVVYQANPSSLVQTIATAEPITSVSSTMWYVGLNISLTPSSGPVNTTVTVTGMGFGWYPTAIVDIYFGNTFITGVAPARDGSFVVNITVPSSDVGLVTVYATESEVGYASANFMVTPTPQFTVTVSGASSLQQYQNQVINVYTDLNGSPVSATVTGTMLNPNGVSQTLSFVSNGVGAYYVVVNATIPGTYSVTVSATYQGITKTVPFSFGVIPRTSTTPTNNTAISSISSAVSSALAELGALQAALSSLQNSLSQLSSNVAAQIATLGSSLAVLSSSLSAISSSVNTAQLYSLGALIVAFIALIVIIYGVLIRRRM